MRALAIAWAACALAACGSGQKGGAPAMDMMNIGSGSVTGTIAGQPFSVAAAFFYDNGAAATSRSVQLSTEPAACSDEVNEVLRRGARDLYLQMQSIQPGSYAVNAMGRPALAYWRRIDASCMGTNGNASSGTIIITRSDAGSLEGSFDLTFDQFTYDMGSEHVTGSFAAVPCKQTGMNPPVTCP